MSTPKLRVDGVTLRFGAVRALNDVSFTVEPGTIHSIIGPNGAGKSSLLNVLSGVYRAQSGSVTWGEKSLMRMRPDQITKAGMGRSFQNLGLSGSQSIADNIMLGRHTLMKTGFFTGGLGLPRARGEERYHRARVMEIADFLELREWIDFPVSELPYGLQKRVDLGRALATEPELLLLDEPVAGMNSGEKRAIGEMLKTLLVPMGLTVLLVEHDMEMVMSLSDRITVIDFGTVIAEGTPDEVRANPAVIGAYLGNVEDEL